MKLYFSFQKTSRYAIVAGMVIIAIAVVNFIYWSASGSNVIDVKNKPIEVRTIRKHPTADGVVILQLDYCKHVNATGRVRASFVSTTKEEFLPVTYERAEAGCYQTEAPVIIPHALTPGEYHVKFRIEYQVNPIKRVVEEFTTEPFEVVAQ